MNRFAVLVGINVFQDPSSNLRGCVNDALDIRTLLISNGWAPENIRLLCDARATRMAIYQRWDWAASTAQPGDDVFLWMSCHGTQLQGRDNDDLEDGLDEALCPYDYPSLWEGGVGPGENAAWYQAMLGRAPKPLICDKDVAIFLKRFKPGVNLIFGADACHSATADRGVLKNNPHPRYCKARYVSPPVDIACRAMDRGDLTVRKFGVKPVNLREKRNANPDLTILDQNHIYISGCRDNQTSADADFNNRPNGAMTWAFLNVLYGNGMKINWINLHERMLKVLKDDGYDQCPNLTTPPSKINATVMPGLVKTPQENTSELLKTREKPTFPNYPPADRILTCPVCGVMYHNVPKCPVCELASKKG